MAIADNIQYTKKGLYTLLAVFLATYFFVILMSHTPNDPSWSHISSDMSSIHNMGGSTGSFISDILLMFLGYVVWWLPIFLIYESVLLWVEYKVPFWFLRVSAYIFLTLSNCALFAQFAAPRLDIVAAANSEYIDVTTSNAMIDYGGVVGYELSIRLVEMLTYWGALLFLIVFVFMTLSFAFSIHWQKLVQSLVRFEWLENNSGVKAGSNNKKRQNSDSYIDEFELLYGTPNGTKKSAMTDDALDDEWMVENQRERHKLGQSNAPSTPIKSTQSPLAKLLKGDSNQSNPENANDNQIDTTQLEQLDLEFDKQALAKQNTQSNLSDSSEINEADLTNQLDSQDDNYQRDNERENERENERDNQQASSLLRDFLFQSGLSNEVAEQLDEDEIVEADDHFDIANSTIAKVTAADSTVDSGNEVKVQIDDQQATQKSTQQAIQQSAEENKNANLATQPTDTRDAEINKQEKTQKQLSKWSARFSKQLSNTLGKRKKPENIATPVNNTHVTEKNDSRGTNIINNPNTSRSRNNSTHQVTNSAADAGYTASQSNSYIEEHVDNSTPDIKDVNKIANIQDTGEIADIDNIQNVKNIDKNAHTENINRANTNNPIKASNAKASEDASKHSQTQSQKTQSQTTSHTHNNEAVSPQLPEVHDDAAFVGKSRAMQTAKYRAELATIPELSILDKPDPNRKPSYTQEELTELSDLLEIKLQDFNVKAEVKNAIAGPVVTRFEVELAPGVKAAKVTGISRDLARSLSMASLRVVEVIPGKPYIGIEVPNKTREMVRLIELLDTEKYRDPNGQISMAMGKNISGQAVITDLAKAPHMLVAGTTGSGKSVLVNAMLLSILLKYKPEQLRLILIDPKQLELANYNDIPHLLTPVVTDMNEAAGSLSWCVSEMERRYQLMSLLKVRKLKEFNKKVVEAETTGIPIIDPLWRPNDSVSVDKAPKLKPLPIIVIVADEFADMMMQVGKQAEELITRLAQKSRAAGIHLMLATQRPSVDVITGLIKANVPVRSALRVNSKVDSRTILDTGGAEDMLGNGDMLFLGPGQIEAERVHGAFVSDEEVNRVCEAWRERGAPEYIENFSDNFELTSPGSGGGGGGTSGEDDSLYNDAVAFVMETRKVSASSIQRKFSIGYNRAARIVDSMEQAGLISGMDKSGKREILM